MTLITDLDGTLIYSKNAGNYCVEHRGDKEVTYMTESAVGILSGLLCRQDFYFIPCTLRSYEQLCRISFAQDAALPIAICDNGFSIYRYGKLDADWDKFMAGMVDVEKVRNQYDLIKAAIESHDLPVYLTKTNRDSFITIVFETIIDLDAHKDVIISCVDSSIYSIAMRGRRLYVIPKTLNKDDAVRYVIKGLEGGTVVTSGDSSVDKEFTSLGDYNVIPKHAVFKHQNSIVTRHEGIVAGEDILRIVSSMY